MGDPAYHIVAVPDLRILDCRRRPAGAVGEIDKHRHDRSRADIHGHAEQMLGGLQVRVLVMYAGGDFNLPVDAVMEYLLLEKLRLRRNLDGEISLDAVLAG
jgi:hypothetical protein